MALIYTVAQQKGGAGKTTLVANLAAAVAAKRRVAVLDIDPQRTLTRWHAIREARSPAPTPLAFCDVSGWRLAGELDRLRGESDVVFVDSPPQTDIDAKLAIRAADLVLIPMQPSPPDLWAAEGTLRLAQSEKKRVCVVFNRSPAVSRLKDLMLKEISARKISILRSALGNRTAYAQAFAAGLGVTEAAPRSAAAAEIAALVEELEGLLA